MSRYVVTMKHVTEANVSVDGKRHERTLYFAGISESIFGNMSTWDRKSKALIFDNYRDAQKCAKLYKGALCDVTIKKL